MRLSSSWRTRRARLAVSLEMPSSNPTRSGLTSSAAAVGVGARRSATKSAIVKSVSWPIPVTTGIGHARIARATISSLKAHKSSMLPPPRTSNMTSHPPSRPAVLSAEAIFSAAPSPWTCTGKTTTSIDGLRRASVVSTSRSAAASRGDHADRARQGRQRSFRVGIEQSLLFELVTEPKESLEQGAEPCAPHGFDIELEIAAGFVQADERLHLDLHTVARRPLEILLALSEHDAAHLGVLVLQDEIGVSRLGNGEVGYLAGHPKQRIAMLEQVPDATCEGRNGENFEGRMRGNPRQSLFSEHVPIVTYPQWALRRFSPL